MKIGNFGSKFLINLFQDTKKLNSFENVTESLDCGKRSRSQTLESRKMFWWYNFWITWLTFSFHWNFSWKPKEGGHSQNHKNSIIWCCVGLLSLSPTFTFLDILQRIFNTAGLHGGPRFRNQIYFCFIYSRFSIYSLKIADILLRLQWFFHKNVLSGNLWRIKNKNQNGSFFQPLFIVGGDRIEEKQIMYNR